MQKCDAFKIIKKLIRILKKKKSKKIFFIKSLKGNKKSQKAYETEFDSFDIISDEFFEKKEIAHIIKEAINKFQFFSWIADIDALFYIIDKIILFNDSFTRMKKRIIKIKKRELYINQISIIIMQSRQERLIKTMRVYYISDLNANLLSYKKLYMLELKDRFDINAIYLYKDYKNILKTNYYEGVYVLIWIFNKFSIEIEIASKHRMLLQTFFALKYKKTKLNEKEDVDDIIITNIEKSQRLQSIKNYYLIYRRFAHFESKILIKLYKIIIYFFIFRFKHKKTCFIYFIKNEKENQSCDNITKKWDIESRVH